MRPFKNIEKEVNSGGNTIGSGFQKLSYYLNEEWSLDLNENDINYINKIIDSKIFNYFNYGKL